MSILRLEDIYDEHSFGGKAVQLGAAARAGLPVPMGYGISHQLVEEVINIENQSVLHQLDEIMSHLGGSCAVRSSAVGEDGILASYAGIFRTELHLTNRTQLMQAIQLVAASGYCDQVHAYRSRQGISSPPKMAVIIQKTVMADCSGVLFTRHPVTHGDVRIIESCWGFGESVVGGRIIPDQYMVSRGAANTQLVIGTKETGVYTRSEGGTIEVPLEDHLKDTASLRDEQIQQLDRLADCCEAHFGAGLDLEWAFVSNSLYLLQCRRMTI